MVQAKQIFRENQFKKLFVFLGLLFTVCSCNVDDYHTVSSVDSESISLEKGDLSPSQTKPNQLLKDDQEAFQVDSLKLMIDEYLDILPPGVGESKERIEFLRLASGVPNDQLLALLKTPELQAIISQNKSLCQGPLVEYGLSEKNNEIISEEDIEKVKKASDEHYTYGFGFVVFMAIWTAWMGVDTAKLAYKNLKTPGYDWLAGKNSASVIYWSLATAAYTAAGITHLSAQKKENNTESDFHVAFLLAGIGTVLYGMGKMDQFYGAMEDYKYYLDKGEFDPKKTNIDLGAFETGSKMRGGVPEPTVQKVSLSDSPDITKKTVDVDWSGKKVAGMAVGGVIGLTAIIWGVVGIVDSSKSAHNAPKLYLAQQLNDDPTAQRSLYLLKEISCLVVKISKDQVALK